MAFNIFGKFTMSGKEPIEALKNIGKEGKGLTQTFARMANVFDMPGLRKLSGIFSGFSLGWKGIITGAATAVATLGVMAYNAGREWVKLNNIMGNFATKSGQSRTAMKGLGKELNLGTGMISGLEITGDATLAVGELEVAYKKLKDEATRTGIAMQLPNVRNIRELIDALDKLPEGQRMGLIEQYFGGTSPDAQNILQYGKAATNVGKALKDTKWAAFGAGVGGMTGPIGQMIGSLAGPTLANKFFQNQEEKDAIKARTDYSVYYQTQANKQIEDMRKQAEYDEMKRGDKIAYKRAKMFSNPAVQAEVKALQEGVIADKKRLDATTDKNEQAKITADIAEKEARYAQMRLIHEEATLSVSELIKQEKKELLDIAEDQRQADDAITEQLLKEMPAHDRIAELQRKANIAGNEAMIAGVARDPMRQSRLLVERKGYLKDIIALQQELNNKIKEERQEGANNLLAKNKELSLQNVSGVAAGTNLARLSSGKRLAQTMDAIERNTRQFLD